MADAILALLAALATSQPVTLSVHLRNDARVGQDTVGQARAIVSQIYLEAGIVVSWSENGSLTVILRPRASAETARRATDAMGYTPGGGEKGGRIAFVMMNRVTEIADGYGSPRSVVLGAAIAHELGHLLLSSAHTSTGIMKAYLNQADFRKVRSGELIFIDEQTERLRTRVMALIPNP